MKVKLTLSVEEELVKRAREKDYNISELVEEMLAKRLRIKKVVTWITDEGEQHE